MKLINKIAKIAGKENFEIDEKIEISYVIRICLKYGMMKIRGIYKSIGKKYISSNIYIGKRVKLISRKNLKIGEKTKIHNNVKIDALSTSGVNIGKGVVIGENTKIECTGSLQRIGKGVSIGDRTSFANDCFFGAAGGIDIGEDVIAGQYIRFHSENHKYEDKNRLIKEQGVTHKGIKIGNNCWIGSGAVFLDGAEIGNGCVVAANAVVLNKFPDNVVIGGMPAKIIKEI